MVRSSNHHSDCTQHAEQTSGVAILGFAPSGKVLLSNEHASSILGYAQDELLTESIDKFIMDGFGTSEVSRGACHLAHLEPTNGAPRQIIIRSRDGGKRVAECSLQSLQTDQGPITLAQFAEVETSSSPTPGESDQGDPSQDATEPEPRFLNTDAFQNTSPLQQDWFDLPGLEAVSEMVQGLSHETRNALQRARGSLDLLDLKFTQVDDRELIERIRRALIDMQTKYEEVRDYAAPIHLTRRPTELFTLIRQVFDEVTSLVPDKQHRLEIEANRNDSELLIDARLFATAIRNLLTNSLAATTDALHVVSSLADSVQEGRPVKTLVLSDHSGGVEPEQLPHLFKPYFTTKQHGSGLGLATVWRIIQAHHGEIQAFNHRPVGLTMEITLPCE